MKIRKKLMPFCLAAAMAGTCVMPVWAASDVTRTDEEWAKLKDNTMEYGELKALIHEYNVTVLNNYSDYFKVKNRTQQEISDNLRNAAGDLYSGIVYPTDDTLPTYAIAYSTAVSMENQAKSLEQQADDNLDDGEIKKLQYDQAEDTIASGAQNSMNSYYQLLESKKTMEANYAVLKAVYDSTVSKADPALGMATQADVLNAQQKLQAMEASLISQDANIKKVKQSLCVMTGWHYDANPEMMPLPAADVGRLDSMNPTADLQKAKDNNYTLKINKRKLENSQSSDTEKTLKNTIADNEQKIGAALNNQYQAVLQAKIAYDQARTDYALEAKNMETAQLKFDMGIISRLEYTQAQAACVEKQVGQATADMALLQAMDTYDWAVNGLLSLN